MTLKVDENENIVVSKWAVGVAVTAFLGVFGVAVTLGLVTMDGYSGYVGLQKDVGYIRATVTEMKETTIAKTGELTDRVSRVESTVSEIATDLARLQERDRSRRAD